jgi:hypothetical protein
MTFNFHASAQLYLGRDQLSAMAQGPRQFRFAAKALRFACEEAAPVSLHGASLVVDGKTYKAAQMWELYRSPANPLSREAALQAA